MNSYTKGPWEDVGANEQGERCIYGADDSAVAVTIPCGNPDQWPDRSISNARLIASAPELLAELEMLSNIVDGCGLATMPEVECRIAFARAAMAKATGESE